MLRRLNLVPFASDASQGAKFGNAVDVDGDRVVVAANLADDSIIGIDVGSVYVFDMVLNSWSETAILEASDRDTGDYFGFALTLSGDRVLVGAHRNNDNGTRSGSAYFFEYTTSWDAGTKVIPSDGAAYDRFGFSVSIDGNKALIGAIGNDDLSSAGSGSVYSYFYNGSNWVNTQLILHTDSERFTDSFGSAISLDGDRAIIGSAYDDGDQGPNFNSGAAYIFDVDEKPVAVMDVITVSEDNFNVIIDVLFNDTDPDGGAKVITTVTQPSNGTTTIEFSDTIIQYSPNADYCNDGITTDHFAYTVNGGSTATVEIIVRCIDDLPVAVDNGVEINEDFDVNIQVLNNDTDIDGGPKFIDSYTQPNNGSVTLSGSTLDYAPDADYCNDGINTDDFTYTLNGGSTATVSVFVNCADDLPEAVADTAIVNEDADAVVLVVLANDTDVENDPVSIISMSQPSNGTVVNNGNNVSYSPDENYCNDGNTTDDFTYTINGGASAGVAVTVTCVDDAPVAVDDNTTLNEDANAVTILILNNDTDIDDGPMLITDITQPSNGNLINNSNNVTYTPNENYCNNGNTTDDFTYTLNGGSSAKVSITVSCIDDLPVAVTDTTVINEDATAIIIDVLANDTDVDGGTMEIGSITQPSNGTTSFTANNVTYTVDADYCNMPFSADNFTYTLTDGASALVNVIVNCVNDAPGFVIDGDLNFDSTGPQQVSIANFADNFVFGPSNESTQQIVGFNVVVNSDGSNIIDTISLDNNGTLNIDFTLNTGVAIISAVMQDNGGTSNGGIDTSNPVEFNISFSDIIFSNGFEDQGGEFTVINLLETIALISPNKKQPIYDYNSDSIEFYDHWLELDLDYSSYTTLNRVKQWLNEILLLESPNAGFDQDGMKNIDDTNQILFNLN